MSSREGWQEWHRSSGWQRSGSWQGGWEEAGGDDGDGGWGGWPDGGTDDHFYPSSCNFSSFFVLFFFQDD